MNVRNVATDQASMQCASSSRPASVEAPAEAAEPPDWLALPTGALQQIFHLNSTWQVPGSCLAAPVCRTWRRAAAGCRGIRLMYHAGFAAADQSFTAWLKCNSQQLEAFSLISDTDNSSRQILAALAEAAVAAQAADRPLRLHSLLVLYRSVDVPTGQLLAHLPFLRCLRLHFHVQRSSDAGRDADIEHLAPLQRATQLEELHLSGGAPEQSLIGLLPLSLKRLSWDLAPDLAPEELPADFSCLTQLSFLGVDARWRRQQPMSNSQLPPGLQQLEVVAGRSFPVEVLEEQRQVVTALDVYGDLGEEQMRVLSHLSRLRAFAGCAEVLGKPAARAAFQELSQVSALELGGDLEAVSGQAAVTTAASMRGLRRLHLQYHRLLAPPAVDALTCLTQLRVSMWWEGHILMKHLQLQEQQQHFAPWREVVGRMAGLQWLSVPEVLLSQDQAWLGGLQQLRVLVLHRNGASEEGMPWLDSCGQEVLPPQLQVLCVSGMTAEQAASWQVRPCLQRLLGSSRCEVVVGVDLDEAADPTQQLAGLPAALQQALAID